jgi:excisionase family DNA binding protein
MSPRESTPTRALYVRIPLAEAAKLDAAAERLGRSKRDVIAGLVAEHLDGELKMGHHRFTPTPVPDVLTLEEAADLLRVEADDLRGWAEAGEIPGRRLGDEWRFRRDALLDWLGSADS